MADDKDADLKLHGPLRRNAPLLAGVAVVLIVGPAFSRLIESYRGIVLEIREGQMFIAREGRPPEWVGQVPGSPGDILVKERMQWSPHTLPPRGDDRELVKLYERYTRTYKGTILRISKPVVPNGPPVALVQLDGGGKMNLPLQGEQLAAAAVGSRLEKTPTSWEPVLVDAPLEDVPGAGGASPSGGYPVHVEHVPAGGATPSGGATE